jgi:predicted DNA-binding mobile mystery protein A
MKPNPRRLHRQRAQLDAKLAKLRPTLEDSPRPRGGWLRAVRESLGMTADQLGKRLGVTKQTVLQLEAGEVASTITLQSLERLAQAMGCRVAYALIPDQSLEEKLDERARVVAEQRLARASHSMSLEGQQPPPDLHQLQITELAKELKEKLTHLWDEP